MRKEGCMEERMHRRREGAMGAMRRVRKNQQIYKDRR